MAKRETTTVTIRLPTELTDKIDKLADGIKYRNRTHFIETAVINFLKEIKE